MAVDAHCVEDRGLIRRTRNTDQVGTSDAYARTRVPMEEPIIQEAIAGRRILARLSLTPSELAECAGVGRSRIFQAIRDGELVARKAGARTTLIEVEAARRWIRSLPISKDPPAEIS